MPTRLKLPTQTATLKIARHRCSTLLRDWHGLKHVTTQQIVIDNF